MVNELFDTNTRRIARDRILTISAGDWLSMKGKSARDYVPIGVCGHESSLNELVYLKEYYDCEVEPAIVSKHEAGDRCNRYNSVEYWLIPKKTEVIVDVRQGNSSQRNKLIGTALVPKTIEDLD